MPSPNDSSNLKSLKNHPEYWIPGGDVTIIVDDVAFRLFSYLLTRESSVFRERLSSSTPSDCNQRPGSNPKHETIVIQAKEKVTPSDFAELCWVFFNKKYSIFDTSLEKWETILRLANQYEFAEVKGLAFRQLEVKGQFPLALVDRIVLYRKYDADRKYLQKLYVDLLSRPEALTLEEGSVLGMTSALIISGARERLRAMSERLSLSDPLPDTMKKITEEMVVSIFWNGPPPDLSRLNTSATGNPKTALARTNGATSSSSSPSSSTTTTLVPDPAPEANKSTPSLFGDFASTGKKGKKKGGLVGMWDD